MTIYPRLYNSPEKIRPGVEHSPFASLCCLLVLACVPAVSPGQLPATDPDYDGPPVGLVDGHESKHPRLFFDPDQFAGIKAYHDSTAGSLFRNRLASQAASQPNYTLSDAIITAETTSKALGTYRLPTLAMHYALTGNQTSWDKAIEIMEFLMDLPAWSGGGEPDCGMPAGNLMVGAAFAYDLLYHDLDPDFGDSFHERLWHQARAMYHLGHLEKNTGGSVFYWQQDPQNNHRFHRLAGLVTAVIAAYTGDPSEDWLLAGTIEEAAFIGRWLPEDGSNHEGISYINYGMGGLLLGIWAADENFGMNNLSEGYFKNTPLFITSATTPGLDDHFVYGDDGGGGSGMNSDQFMGVRLNGLKDVQAFIDKKGLTNSGDAWMHLAMNLPVPAGGSMDDLPRKIHFPNLGVSYFKEGWELTDTPVRIRNVAAMFKCGPFGGHRLNEYRDAYDFHYINIAHDDPDANNFMIWEGRTFTIANDGYSSRKRSSNHNTILVNNLGQRAPGESEGNKWTQPTDQDVSMDDMAYVTNWKNEGQIAITEGEAAGSYPGTPLNRYRRSFIWNEGKYILLFDDIRADNPANITWLLQTQTMTADDPDNGEFIAATWNRPRSFQLKSNRSYTYKIAESTADNRGASLGRRQLQASFMLITDLQVATLFRMWEDALEMTFESVDADHATITITGATFEDVWTWQAAADDDSSGEFTLLSSDGQSFDSEPHPWLESLPGFTYDSWPWTVSTWFGNYYPDDFPWVYHQGHGWLWLHEPGKDFSGWMWSFDLGWILVRKDIYPWVYQDSEAMWIRL